MSTSGATKISCSHGCGTISIPKDASQEKINQLKKEATRIQAECSNRNIYMCKCELADFLKNRLSDMRNR